MTLRDYETGRSITFITSALLAYYPSSQNIMRKICTSSCLNILIQVFCKLNPFLGPIHMHKIYTCKNFASWSKNTHISKSIFTLCSHAYSVHISILKDTHTCCTADMPCTDCWLQLPCYLCTGLALRLSHEKLLGRKSNLMSGWLMLSLWHLLMINGTE